MLFRSRGSESMCNSPKVIQLACCRPCIRTFDVHLQTSNTRLQTSNTQKTIHSSLLCPERATCPCLAPLCVLTAFLFLSPLENLPSQMLTSKDLVCLGFSNGQRSVHSNSRAGIPKDLSLGPGSSVQNAHKVP